MKLNNLPWYFLCLLLFSISCKPSNSTQIDTFLEDVNILISDMRTDSQHANANYYKDRMDQLSNRYKGLKVEMTDRNRKDFLKNAYSFLYLNYGIEGMNTLEDTSNMTAQLILDETFVLFNEGGKNYQEFILELYDENQYLLNEFQKTQLESVEETLEDSHEGLDHHHDHHHHDH